MEDFKSPPTSLTKRCITHWYNISCEELISTLHSKEEEWKRYSNHLPTICPDPKVIEFIFSVSLYLNSLGIEVLPVTRYSAVRLLQLYLERKSVSTSSSKQKSHNSVESTVLPALASLHIMQKKFSTIPIPLSQMPKLSRPQFSNTDMTNSEREILATVGFRLDFLTPIDYIDIYTHFFSFQVLRPTVMKVLDLVYSQPSSFLPVCSLHLLAISVLCTASTFYCKIPSIEVLQWGNEMSGHSVSDIASLSNKITKFIMGESERCNKLLFAV
eukprot:TRINITY_DN1586_c1_g1_i7.p1 TRINITY_DN1586_c1_g1~~TRINITY_DN1586_c1_g1_i7.p1  ORF type:complete len:271 (+),score=14.12 TRINITY_DN1586_c1_g1_i7:170-982(+)